MRKLVLLPAAALVSALASAPLSHDATADVGAPPSPTVPGPHSPPIPVPPVIKHGRVQAFPDGKWTGETVVFQVDVENPASSAYSGEIDFQRSEGAFRQTSNRRQVSLNVPAGATQTVSFTDPFPVPRCLGETTYDVWFADNRQSRMQLKFNPSCTFAYTTAAGWEHLDPGQLAAAKQDALYYQNAKVTVPPTCSKTNWFTVSADVVNGGKASAKGVTLTLVAPPDKVDLTSNPTPPFETDPGYPQNGATVSEWFWGLNGTYTLSLAEQSGPRVAQPGFGVKVTQSCTVATSFAKPAEWFE
jgi:hypothetical protein